MILLSVCMPEDLLTTRQISDQIEDISGFECKRLMTGCYTHIKM